MLNKVRASVDVRRKHYDIIHPTYYNMSYGRKAKIILDVHDMIPEMYPMYRWTKKLASDKKKTLHEADRIISVSEYTKRDMLRFYPDIEPERVSVIYRGTMMQPQPESSRRFTIMDGRDYVLFVGNRRLYKNFARFFEAMKGVMSVHKDLCLFCAGGGAFTKEERAAIDGLEARVFQGGLTDDELIDAYMNALCFVFPSEYEGFGLPVLEAFACRCPLVCSHATVFPEVAGNAAEYFDPFDADDMAAKILNVLGSENLRNSLKVRGLERLKFFSWEKAARETLKCYDQAMKQ
ncbi:MAG: glycosyltransferase family 4 protein [Synergistaceae bacterium]|nr:glycosyltransferase family 4 protein [Synergistaceae bacterium]